MTKTKILVCSESSKVASGFGVYNKNLLEGLYKTDNYELAEFASYGLLGDKEKYNIPWKYYPNAVHQTDSRFSLYQSDPTNGFGKWRFDRVVVDFKPDIVIDVRDYWMSSYQKSSPFRKYFHWILMPTVDSAPQQDEWLDTYADADAIFTYSDWGKSVLENQSNSINIIGSAPPGADFSSFLPHVNNAEIKKSLCIDPEYTVVGTVMRNQKRKLFPELIFAFEKMLLKLKEAGSPKFDKTILYLHTSYPDAGWDFNGLLKDSQFSNKIYFTYCCRKCNAIFASNIGGYVQKCYNCGNQSATMPNVANPISTNILGKIMSAFDVYVQYSICEGFGMPQVEAAACGVPVVTVNYSAMIDVINNLNAFPVDIGAYFKELETTAIRVYPNENSLINILLDLISKPEQMRKRIGFNTSNLTKKYYDWNITLKKWIEYLDSVDTSIYRNRWKSKPNILPLIDFNKINDKENSSYEIVYTIKNILSQINMKISDYWLLKQIQAAQNGFYTEQAEFKQFSIKTLLENLNTMISNHNNAEIARTKPDMLAMEDFIGYANNK